MEVCLSSVTFTVDGTVAWSGDAAQNGWTGYRSTITNGYRYYLTSPSLFTPLATVSVAVSADDTASNNSTLNYTFTIEEPDQVVRVPIGALYLDYVRDGTPEGNVDVINQIPEDGETGVPADTNINLHVVSIPSIALAQSVKVYVTRSSTSTKALVYDQAGGGFQSGWQGSDSSATNQSSPGTTVTDDQ